MYFSFLVFGMLCCPPALYTQSLSYPWLLGVVECEKEQEITLSEKNALIFKLNILNSEKR